MQQINKLNIFKKEEPTEMKAPHLNLFVYEERKVFSFSDQKHLFHVFWQHEEPVEYPGSSASTNQNQLL